MTWCQETASVACITVPAYWGTEKDAADLVEYLNAPNNGANPNGGTDWAAVRAADGHGSPYGVLWFEYDADAWHGDHAPSAGRPISQRLSPDDYAERYLRYREAMRAVDPQVRLGAAVPAAIETWNRPVLEKIGDRIDFAVTSFVLPLWEGEASPDQSRPLLQASLAVGAQAQAAWERLNALVEETCGRTDLRWTITELGNGYVQELPVPYRHTLGAALGQAELLRVLMDPRLHIASAAARGFANGEWGMIMGYVHQKEPLRRQAMAMIYELYAQHFGDIRLDATVGGDRWDFAGAAYVLPRSGPMRVEFAETAELLSPTAGWVVQSLPSLPQQRAEGKLLVVEFPGTDIDYRHAAITLPAKPGAWYRVRGMIKTDGLTGNSGARLDIGDGGTGAAAKPISSSLDVLGSADWTEVMVDYHAPADAEKLVITARRRGRHGGPDAVAGKACYRLFSVREMTPANYAAVPDVSVNAARRKDGTVTTMLVNTNSDRDQTVTLEVSGAELKGTSQAQVWLMTGQTPWANNLGREDAVRLWKPQSTRTERGWTVQLPKHSMAAVEITP
jgi:alpha-N-arabinofuranosidase